MKRWHNRNECSGEQSQGKEGEKDQARPQEGAEGGPDMDYLKSVGESVAAMLDPFGIDVEVDVEHRGRRHGCGRQGRGGHCSRGRQGKSGSCHRSADPTNKSEKEKEPRDEMMEETGAPTEKENTVPKGNTPQPMEGDKEEITPQKMETQTPPYPPQGSFNGPKGKDSEEWTVLDTDGPAPMQYPPQTTGATANPPPVLIYPPTDPKIAEALQQMIGMGFHNEGGWLQRLLVEKDGDISKVLDAIQPKANRTPDGGYMA